MAYVIYVNQGYNIASFILSLFTIYYCINVLLRKNILKKSVKLSPTITVYFGFIFIFSVAWIVYYAYIIIFWRPDDAIYNAYILYFTGLIPALSFNTSVIAETFLCIERCISLLFPLKYSQKFKNYFALLTIFGMLGIMAAAAVVNKFFENFPSDPKTACLSFSCVGGASNKYLFTVRIGLDVVNIISALILAYLIKRTIINSKSAAQMNKTVFILLISTTLIELVPFVSQQIFVMITGEELFQYVGSYGSTAIIFNTVLSVTLYYKAFKKFTKNDSSVKFLATTVATTATTAHHK